MKNDFERQVAELLKAAMKQPGVADAMKIYELSAEAREAQKFAQQALEPRWIVSTSTSSGTIR